MPTVRRPTRSRCGNVAGDSSATPAHCIGSAMRYRQRRLTARVTRTTSRPAGHDDRRRHLLPELLQARQQVDAPKRLSPLPISPRARMSNYASSSTDTSSKFSPMSARRCSQPTWMTILRRQVSTPSPSALRRRSRNSKSGDCGVDGSLRISGVPRVRRYLRRHVHRVPDASLHQARQQVQALDVRLLRTGPPPDARSPASARAAQGQCHAVVRSPQTQPSTRTCSAHRRRSPSSASILKP